MRRRSGSGGPSRDDAPKAASLTVHVRPRAGRTAILGRRADLALEVLVRAPPEGGKANAELIGLLARALGLPRQAFAIVRGSSARTKVVRITGASPEAVARLGIEDRPG